MATPVCIVADDTGKRNKHNKKAAGNPAAFHLYQNHSAGTNPGHHFPLCARTASGLSPGLGLVDFSALHNEAAAGHGSDVLHGIAVKGNHISKLAGLDAERAKP